MSVPDSVSKADEFRARWTSLVVELGRLEEELDDDQQIDALDESLDQVELVIEGAAQQIEERGPE